jgi:Zn-dependent protease with chaperone function
MTTSIELLWRCSYAAAMLLLLGLLQGCATNPVTGRSQLMIVSEKAAIANSKQAYSATMSNFEKKGKVSSDQELKKRVDLITGRLIAQAIRYRPETKDWEWSVAVIDEPETLNAWCMPGGKMAIFTGIIGKLDASDDEIAQIMGHEIGHALANHGAEKMSTVLLSNVLVQAAAATARSREGRDLALQGGALAANVAITLPNSRETESEADRIGIELAARAGYNPEAAPALWQKMAEASGQKGRFDFLSTHPAPVKRQEELASLVAPMKRLYQPDAEHPVFAFKGSAAPPVSSGTFAFAEPMALVPQQSSESLKIHTAAYERFISGSAELTCGSACAMPYSWAMRDLRSMASKGQWRALAERIMAINHAVDVAYLYLGKAATGLGYTDMAVVYYTRAIELAHTKEGACKGSLMDLCDNLHPADEASKLLDVALGGNFVPPGGRALQ